MMLKKLSMFKATLAATVLTVTISCPVVVCAQSRSAADLLAALSNSDAQTAVQLDRELQAQWAKSGSAAVDLLLRRGENSLSRGELRQAVEHLTAVIDHAPDFAVGWVRRSEAFARMEQFGPAVSDLEQALALNPNDYNALYGLGVVFEHFRDPKQAFDAYQRAKAIHPHHEKVTTALERLMPIVVGREL